MLSIGDNTLRRTSGATPWFSRKSVWILIYSIVIGAAVALMFKPSEPLTQSVSIKTSTQPLNVVQQEENLAEFHLFGKPSPKITEVEQSLWQLQGIIMNSEHEGVAILLVNNKTMVLKAGDTISSGVTVHKIEQDKILVLEDGQLKRLSLFKPMKSIAHKPASKAKTPQLERRAFHNNLSPAQRRFLQ